MQYLVIEAIQDSSYSHVEISGGATVGCWIKDQSEKNSRFIAKSWIREQGWIPQDILEHQVITIEDYDAEPEGREYFDQAILDEEVFVFFTFPE